MISSNTEFANIINISGKQRMLSQRLIVVSANYNIDSSLENKYKLESVLKEMENSHEFLLTKQFNQNIKDIYTKDKLNNILHHYLLNFKNILKNNDVKYRSKAREESNHILLKLDKVVKEYEKYSNEKLQELEQYEFYLMLVTLFSLIFSALFIFRPASIKIQKQTNELINKEHYVETVIESNSNAIIAINWTGKITTFNKQAEIIFGWTQDEMINTRNLLNIIPTKYKSMHTKASTKYLTSGVSAGIIGKTHELEGIRKNGEVFLIRISFGSTYKVKGAIVVANIEDMTYEKKQELLIIQQSKMASMGEMIANIAHQWRQPLSAITTISSGSIVQKELGILSEEDITKSYEKIINHANFLSETINDFRDFFQETKEKSPFDILKQIENIKSITKNNYASNNIQIIQNNIDNKIICIGMKNKFAQVIMNVLNNAKDILVEKKLNDKLVYIDIKVNEKNCNIDIYDNGGGIPNNVLPKIFDAYFTTKEKSDGTGIGLHMSSEIIHKHFDGTIQAVNKEFEVDGMIYYGACFIINIPLN